MAKYRVWAEVVRHIYLDVEANSVEEAWNAGLEADGAEFLEDSCHEEWNQTEIYGFDDKGIPLEVENPFAPPVPFFEERWYVKDVTDHWPDGVPQTRKNIGKAIKEIKQIFDSDRNIEYRNEAIGRLLADMAHNVEFEED